MSARILVVDDEPDMEALVTQIFRRQLRDGTVSLVFARDGVDALAAVAADSDIDMVVSDINMPRMDGLTLLEKLQDVAKQLSTIVVSAYGDMTNIRIAMNRGAFDFLTKPIDRADLEATIARTLRHLGACLNNCWQFGGESDSVCGHEQELSRLEHRATSAASCIDTGFCCG